MDIDLSFSHQLSDDEVKTRVKKNLAEKPEKHKKDLKFNAPVWQLEASCVLKGKVMSFSLIGKLEFPPGSVRIKADLPVMLKFFRGRIAAEINKEMEILLKN